MSKKRIKRLRALIKPVGINEVRAPCVEPAEVLLMMETLARWCGYDHRHKTFPRWDFIKIVARLMEMKAEPNRWVMGYNWPLIAFHAGIDTKSFTIIDPHKFKWFWYQVGQTGKFSIKRQQELIKSKDNPPEIQPLMIAAPYWTPKVKTQKLHAEAVKENQNNYMKEEIMEHFFV